MSPTPTIPRRRRFGDFVLEKLASRLAAQREAAELELIAAVLAGPHQGIATARESGVEGSSLIRDEVRLCWDAVELLDSRARLRADLEFDRALTFDLICAAYPACFPARWVPGTFGSIWPRQQQLNHLHCSAHWSRPLIGVLFDLYPPGIAQVRRLSADLIAIINRGKDAMEHWRYAARLLRGEDVIEEWYRPAPGDSATHREQEVAA